MKIVPITKISFVPKSVYQETSEKETSEKKITEEHIQAALNWYKKYSQYQSEILNKQSVEKEANSLSSRTYVKISEIVNNFYKNNINLKKIFTKNASIADRPRNVIQYIPSAISGTLHSSSVPHYLKRLLFNSEEPSRAIISKDQIDIIVNACQAMDSLLNDINTQPLLEPLLNQICIDSQRHKLNYVTFYSFLPYGFKLVIRTDDLTNTFLQIRTAYPPDWSPVYHKGKKSVSNLKYFGDRIRSSIDEIISVYRQSSDKPLSSKIYKLELEKIISPISNVNISDIENVITDNRPEFSELSKRLQNTTIKDVQGLLDQHMAESATKDNKTLSHLRDDRVALDAHILKIFDHFYQQIRISSDNALLAEVKTIYKILKQKNTKENEINELDVKIKSLQDALNKVYVSGLPGKQISDFENNYKKEISDFEEKQMTLIEEIEELNTLFASKKANIISTRNVTEEIINSTLEYIRNNSSKFDV